MKRIIAAIALAAFALPVASLADSDITAVGSTALLPLVKQSATEYESKHSGVKISVSGGGSLVGVSQVAAGAVDIGDSDVLAPAGTSGLVDHKVAVVGFAIITHPGVGVNNVRAAQVRDIFSGKIKNWKEVGGKDQPIVIVNRPRSSGTRKVFTKTFMGDTPIDESGLTEDASGTVVTTVGQTPGAVSYLAFGYEGSKVSELKVDGVAPTVDNVRSGKWPMWSYEHMFTKGEAKPDVANFIKYVADNSPVLDQFHYIQISSMKVAENDR
jgi:phosphate transport system substrate-binding protein